MKRFLITLSILFVSLIAMSGCAAQTKFVDTNLIPLAESLTLHDKEIDTDFSDMSEYSGKASMVMVDDDTLNYIFYDDGVALISTIYLGSNTLTGFNVWSYDIDIFDYENERYIYFEFMHEDYSDERVSRTMSSFVDALLKFTKDDIIYLIEKLDAIN